VCKAVLKQGNLLKGKRVNPKCGKELNVCVYRCIYVWVYVCVNVLACVCVRACKRARKDEQLLGGRACWALCARL